MAARAVVARLGVGDPKNPSARDFKLIFDAYLKDKSLDTDAFNTYVKSLSAPLKAMCEGFAQFSADQQEVAKKSIDVIQQAMEILQGELKRANISDDERRELLDRVLRLVAEARDEAERERTFRARLAYGVLGGLALVTGVAVAVLTAGRYPQLMEKGLEMAGKAAAKAAA
jgi:hypothetical protein